MLSSLSTNMSFNNGVEFSGHPFVLSVSVIISCFTVLWTIGGFSYFAVLFESFTKQKKSPAKEHLPAHRLINESVDLTVRDCLPFLLPLPRLANNALAQLLKHSLNIIKRPENIVIPFEWKEIVLFDYSIAYLFDNGSWKRDIWMKLCTEASGVSSWEDFHVARWLSASFRQHMRHI